MPADSILHAFTLSPALPRRGGGSTLVAVLHHVMIYQKRFRIPLSKCHSGLIALTAKNLFVCSRIKRPDLAFDRIGVRRKRRLIQVCLRPGFIVKMPILVRATRKRRGVTHLGLAHIGRDVSNRQADAPVSAAVWLSMLIVFLRIPATDK